MADDPLDFGTPPRPRPGQAVFVVSGLDARSGKPVKVEITAESQKVAFDVAKTVHGVFPKSAVRRGGSRWVYKMVQIPPNIQVNERDEDDQAAAVYLEDVVNEYSEQGWEFYRVDPVGVLVMPGCLASLFRHPTQRNYYVVTFRQWVEA